MISEKSIAESISVLGFRLGEQIQAKANEGIASKLAETDQQSQAEIAGKASNVIVWTKVTVTFDETIYVAPAQRDNPLQEPHFTFGSTMQSDTPVMLHATVQKWLQDHSGNFTGAIVSVGVRTDEEALVPYKATVHMTFQGFSSPNYPTTGEGEG